MKTDELVKRLREYAEWARANEWEVPICLADDLEAAVDKLAGVEWLDPEIEVPPDDGAVLGIVNGAIDGIEHRNAVLLVCYDSGEWWLFDRPSIDANVYRWMPLPEPPEED